MTKRYKIMIKQHVWKFYKNSQPCGCIVKGHVLVLELYDSNENPPLPKGPVTRGSLTNITPLLMQTILHSNTASGSFKFRQFLRFAWFFSKTALFPLDILAVHSIWQKGSSQEQMSLWWFQLHIPSHATFYALVLSEHLHEHIWSFQEFRLEEFRRVEQ